MGEKWFIFTILGETVYLWKILIMPDIAMGVAVIAICMGEGFP